MFPLSLIHFRLTNRTGFLFGWLTVVSLLMCSIVGSDSSSKDKAQADDTINVFSVASGHLYERFLR